MSEKSCYGLTAMDRVIAFLNLFDGDCKTCFRRDTLTCASCRSTTAKSILAQIQSERKLNDSGEEPDYSLYARMAIIEKSIAKAGRPVRSDEIKLTDIATPQLKAWTLLRMIHNGVIGRRREGKYYVYYITKNRKGKTK